MEDCPMLEKRLLSRVQAESPFPLAVMMVLTEACNLQCPHCYEFKGRPLDQLSTGEIKDILQQLADAGTLFINFTGGEPSLRPDLVEIVRAAGALRFSISLKTNGTLFSPRDVEALWQAGLSKLQVSLYSDDPALHDDFVKLPGAFAKTTESLKRFRALGGIAHAGIIAMNWNVHRVPALLDLCERNGWTYGVDLRICPALDGDSAPVSFQISDEQLEKMLDDKRLFDASLLGEIPPIPLDSQVCGAGVNAVVIRPDGEVVPC